MLIAVKNIFCVLFIIIFGTFLFPMLFVDTFTRVQNSVQKYVFDVFSDFKKNFFSMTCQKCQKSLAKI